MKLWAHIAIGSGIAITSVLVSSIISLNICARKMTKEIESLVETGTEMVGILFEPDKATKTNYNSRNSGMAILYGNGPYQK